MMACISNLIQFTVKRGLTPNHLRSNLPQTALRSFRKDKRDSYLPNFVFNIAYSLGPSVVTELSLSTSGWSENQLDAASDLAKVVREAVIDFISDE